MENIENNINLKAIPPDEAIVFFGYKSNVEKAGVKEDYLITHNVVKNPHIASIIASFERFLISIGFDREVISDYIKIPELDGIDFSEFEDDEDYALDEEDLNNIRVKFEYNKDVIDKYANDEKGLESFLNEINNNPDFKKKVFKIFLDYVND